MMIKIRIRIRKGRRKGPSTCWYQGNLDGPLRRIEESAPGKEKPPRITLGETENRFLGMPGQDSWIYRGRHSPT